MGPAVQAGLKEKRTPAEKRGQIVWEMRPFKNEARRDGLELRHWAKCFKDNAGRVRLAEEGDYPFARLDCKVCHLVHHLALLLSVHMCSTYILALQVATDESIASRTARDCRLKAQAYRYDVTENSIGLIRLVFRIGDDVQDAHSAGFES